MKKTHDSYSQAYKDEALALADRIGISAAARELGCGHHPGQALMGQGGVSVLLAARACPITFQGENQTRKGSPHVICP